MVDVAAIAKAVLSPTGRGLSRFRSRPPCGVFEVGDVYAARYVWACGRFYEGTSRSVLGAVYAEFSIGIKGAHADEDRQLLDALNALAKAAAEGRLVAAA